MEEEIAEKKNKVEELERSSNTCQLAGSAKTGKSAASNDHGFVSLILSARCSNDFRAIIIVIITIIVADML